MGVELCCELINGMKTGDFEDKESLRLEALQSNVIREVASKASKAAFMNFHEEVRERIGPEMCEALHAHTEFKP